MEYCFGLSQRGEFLEGSPFGFFSERSSLPLVTSFSMSSLAENMRLSWHFVHSLYFSPPGPQLLDDAAAVVWLLSFRTFGPSFCRDFLGFIPFLLSESSA